MTARKLEQIQGAIDISFGIQQRLCERGTHARASREVHDALKSSSGKDVLYRCKIGNVGLMKFIAGLVKVGSDILSLDGRIVEIIEVVDNSDFPSALGK